MDASEQSLNPDTVIAATESVGNRQRRIDVGVLAATAPGSDPEAMRSFSERVLSTVVDALAAAADVPWRFHAERPVELSDPDDRRPSEFLDHATHRMVQGPYDLVVVLTDVPLVSSRKRYVPGLASPLARVAVLSTWTLLSAGRGRPRRTLESPTVRANAATLVLHLIGHVLGAGHHDTDGGVMEPFEFDPDRERAPPFDAEVEQYLERIAGEVPEPDARSRTLPRRLGFYAASAIRHPGAIARSIIRSRAPLLPFSLPKLATAAVAPTLVIVFSAESWDVGFHLSDATAALFATASVVTAATYLLFAQNLSFPRKHHRVVTEHTALVNVTIFVLLLLAMVGLFALVSGIILVIELFVFPANLMSNWPSLQNPAVGTADLVRTAVFISTIGVLSGALAGGLESRTIIRHLTLFLDEP